MPLEAENRGDALGAEGGVSVGQFGEVVVGGFLARAPAGLLAFRGETDENGGVGRKVVLVGGKRVIDDVHLGHGERTVVGVAESGGRRRHRVDLGGRSAGRERNRGNKGLALRHTHVQRGGHRWIKKRNLRS